MRYNKFVFDKPTLNKLPFPLLPITKYTYYDSCQPGLALIITYGGTKAFYFCKTLNNRTMTYKIGDFPYMSVEQARAKIFEMLQDLQQGITPMDTKSQKRKTAITLADFFNNEYIPKHLKFKVGEKRCGRMTSYFNRCFKHISHKLLGSITKEELDTMHKSLGQNNGIYAANAAICLIKRIYNRAIDTEFAISNPATKIKLFKEKSRERFIQPDEMPRFMKALLESENEQMKNYTLLLLLTGQRGCNVKSLKWSDIDFHNNSLYLEQTKNGESQRIPLTEQAIGLLNQIKDKRTDNSDFIFPCRNTQSKNGYMNNPNPYWRELLQKAEITNLRMHDLRRTMASYQAIIGSSLNIIGKSLGHKSIQATTIYAKLDLNPVRESMQKATDKIFNLSNNQ
ncbi:MAG: site-specific integrase [Alphaproteobacteria bacterium]|nr:site-specific integrase [Alphaproteobacteria bacterium]